MKIRTGTVVEEKRENENIAMTVHVRRPHWMAYLYHFVEFQRHDNWTSLFVFSTPNSSVSASSPPPTCRPPFFFIFFLFYLFYFKTKALQVLSFSCLTLNLTLTLILSHILTLTLNLYQMSNSSVLDAFGRNVCLLSSCDLLVFFTVLYVHAVLIHLLHLSDSRSVLLP